MNREFSERETFQLSRQPLELYFILVGIGYFRMIHTK